MMQSDRRNGGTLRAVCISAWLAVAGGWPEHAETGLPRSDPGSQGVAVAGLLDLVDALDRHEGLHGLVVVRHGRVIAEGWWKPYDAATPHALYSLSKSFTATAVGLAVADGRLAVADRVVSFFPDQAPGEMSPHLREMRVADLLRMATGHQTDPPRPAAGGWVKAFLAHPVPFKPGTHFLYSSSATFMQSAIVEKVTGEPLLEYLAPRLLAPLGIEGATWEQNPDGIAVGGYGLSLRTGDIAAFGQLLLQRGRWRDRQIVPAEWIDAATARQTANGSDPDSDWDQGYGYQFWRCRHGAFRGDGAFGQFCVVMPRQDAVVAITAGTSDMQGILDIVWRHLLPALGEDAVTDEPVILARLRARLADLSLPTPTAGPPAAAFVGRRFTFADNPRQIEAAAVEPGEKSDLLQLRIAGREERIVCGRGRWVPGKLALGTLERQAIAAAGGWQGDSFTARICFPRTPFLVTIALDVTGDGVTLRQRTNVGFGRLEEEPLRGTATRAAPGQD